jgi:hypothetical protein
VSPTTTDRREEPQARRGVIIRTSGYMRAPQDGCCTPGITDGTKVFHSFRRSFIEAPRLAGVPGEINIALVGHTDPSVNGKYGAKDKAVRFRQRLAEAIASVVYAGLELSHLTSPRAAQGHQGAHAPPRR